MAWWRKLKKNNAVAVTLAPEGRFGHFLGSLRTAQDILSAAEIFFCRYPDKTCCQSTGPFYWFIGILGYFLEGGLFSGGHLGWQGALEEAPAGVWGIVRTA